ncbi:MAG: hypothetical protein F6J86_41320 [Symploca sp. SIO1B1]|nr:hypothetical protein [Symploca sp. SIO1B1]
MVKLGTIKVKFCRRLGDDWYDLADFFEIPTAARERWEQGLEPKKLWECLGMVCRQLAQ